MNENALMHNLGPTAVGRQVLAFFYQAIDNKQIIVMWGADALFFAAR